MKSLILSSTKDVILFLSLVNGANMGSRKIMQKENQSNGPINSHRSLFDATDKKEPYAQSNHNGEEGKQRNKYPYSIYRS